MRNFSFNYLATATLECEELVYDAYTKAFWYQLKKLKSSGMFQFPGFHGNQTGLRSSELKKMSEL